MMFDKSIVVSGVVVKLRPYTALREEQLMEIQAEIEAYAKENPHKTFAEIHDLRAEWWMRKAQILWEPEKPLDIEFFKSKEFELTLLQDTEDFFLSKRGIL